MHIIGGSLGSGKTTLLQRVLSGDCGRVAVLMNEFGDIDIDGAQLRGRDIEIVELTGGCVCCSLAGEFAAGVRELIDTAAPEAILVETTGVAEADALIEDIEDDLPEVRLETVVILVDADTTARFPEFGRVEAAQLAAADLILINKTDLVAEADLAPLRERLSAVNPRARRLETRHADVDPALILAGAGAQRERPRRAAHVHQHGMETFSWRPPGSLRRHCFETAVARWPAAVYRAKGRLLLDGEPRLFNYVAGRWGLDDAGGGEPALVWIGASVQRHRREIIDALETCLE